MKEVTLSVVPREGKGKGPARQTRMVGFIPGVIYGPQTKPESIKVDNRAFNAAWKTAGGGSVIFSLEKGGAVHFCSRIGCEKHYVSFEDIYTTLTSFYHEYDYGARDTDF